MNIGMITDSPGTLSFHERLDTTAELRGRRGSRAQFRPGAPLLEGADALATIGYDDVLEHDVLASPSLDGIARSAALLRRAMTRATRGLSR
jgi:hypothetical protein